MNKIITISRTYGSGGNNIGKLVAEKLNIPFYDREIIEKAAKDSGLAEEYFENAESKAGNKLLYRLYIGMTTPQAAPMIGYHTPITINDSVQDMVFNAQSNIIQEIAREGSCVIVGRCADYVLRNNPNVISIFVWSGLEARIQRIMERRQLGEEEATEEIKKMDKRRENYYNYHTTRTWGKADNYELTLRSDLLELERCADLIVSYAKSSK
ncbi:MAG: cytidylate kinase-like family protein [Clostridiales bacterium]|nr:cytidylate kinase-like family protein [Clostridiales bacterium]